MCKYNLTQDDAIEMVKTQQYYAMVRRKLASENTDEPVAVTLFSSGILLSHFNSILRINPCKKIIALFSVDKHML